MPPDPPTPPLTAPPPPPATVPPPPPTTTAPPPTVPPPTATPPTTTDKRKTTFLRALRKKVDAINTHPGLMELLLTNIEKLTNDEDPSETQVPEELQLLVDSQASIGWKQLFKGRFSGNKYNKKKPRTPSNYEK